MGFHTASGTKIFIGGKGALAAETGWVEIGEVEDLGEFGRKYNKIEVKSLGNRGIRKAKSSFDDGSIRLKIHADADDLGQDALATAVDDDDAYNFKIEENDAGDGVGATPTTSKFRAKVMGMPKSVGSGDSVVDFTVELEIDSGTLVVTAATAGT